MAVKDTDWQPSKYHGKVMGDGEHGSGDGADYWIHPDNSEDSAPGCRISSQVNTP
jgi:hypothetical protein